MSATDQALELVKASGPMTVSDLMEAGMTYAAATSIPNDDRIVFHGGAYRLVEQEIAPDYADVIAERIRGVWLTSTTDTRDLQKLIAEGVREGYALGMGAAS